MGQVRGQTKDLLLNLVCSCWWLVVVFLLIVVAADVFPVATNDDNRVHTKNFSLMLCSNMCVLNVATPRIHPTSRALKKIQIKILVFFLEDHLQFHYNNLHAPSIS